LALLSLEDALGIERIGGFSVAKVAPFTTMDGAETGKEYQACSVMLKT
jgi:hypothetical protein